MAKVLLVDDDKDFRNMVRLMLLKQGHVVVEAADGKQAFELYQNSPADVVLTDLVMPEQEGLETIKKFRSNWPDLKIVAMSGGLRGSSADFLKIAAHLGANRTLSKPFSFQDLSLTMESLLRDERQA